MKTLKEINIEYPTLNTNGWGYVCEYTNKYITSDDITKRPKEFNAICNFLDKNIKHIKSINYNSTSYGYKHILEDNINHYVTNGLFIAAALACGYKMKYKLDYGPNAFFAMSQKDWSKLHKTRGDSGPPLDDI
jgi:hypothetical protein